MTPQMRTPLARPGLTLGLMMAVGLMTPSSGAAQDPNILLPVDTIVERLTRGDFEIIDLRPSRGLEGERTYRSALSFPDGTTMLAKWAPAPPGGEEFNNSPRYEVAAYRIQSLFLEPGEYVVPPTVIRAFPLEWHRQAVDGNSRATFRGTESVLVVLQYWLFNVTSDDFWDEERFAADTAYARNFGNFNILTYLIRHNDENEGNYLVSSVPENPRVFSVDNGLAFESEASDRGTHWRRIRVDRLPAGTIRRLRALSEQEVTAALQTLAQFRVGPDGSLAAEAPGPAIGGQGVRYSEDVVQFGLTAWEIREVWRRIQRLVDDADDGDYTLF